MSPTVRIPKDPRFRLVEELRLSAATAELAHGPVEVYIVHEATDGTTKTTVIRADADNLRRMADLLEQRWAS